MMNRHTLKGVLILLALATLTHFKADCQDRKAVTIVILNGDTTINGKKLSKVSKEERELLLKDFKNTENTLKVTDGTGLFLAPDIKNEDLRDLVIKSPRGSITRIFGDTSKLKELRIDRMPGGSFFKFNGDSLFASLGDSSFFNRFDFNLDNPVSMFRDRNNAVWKSPNESNSQSFSYNSTDKDGISTTMSFRISDASKEVFEKITGILRQAQGDKANIFEVDDLTLFPNFSSGKVTLSLTIPIASSKADKALKLTEIKVLDNNLNEVFSEKLTNSGTYTKQLILPKNGLYYITVSQGGKWFVKKVLKQ